MEPKEITWPNLTQLDTMALPIVMLLWVLACVVAGTALEIGWLPALGFVPLGLLLGVDALNEVRRLLWLRSFDEVVSMRKLRKRISAHPEQFRFHFASYSGFDVIRLRPTIVVDDMERGLRMAIYPGAWRNLDELRALGIRECRERRREQSAGGDGKPAPQP